MRIRDDIYRMILLALSYSCLWWIITEASTYQFWLGAIFVVIATIVTPRSRGARKGISRSRLKALANFIIYFIYQSLKGGFLVAKLAFLPQRLLHSEFYDYQVQIAPENTLTRMFFAASLCVFPGTLSCGYRENILVIHALDIDNVDHKAIRDLEAMTDELFSPALR